MIKNMGSTREKFFKHKVEHTSDVFKKKKRFKVVPGGSSSSLFNDALAPYGLHSVIN